jgi:uncharacterized protein YlaI
MLRALALLLHASTEEQIATQSKRLRLRLVRIFILRECGKHCAKAETRVVLTK